jgi:hypothetical protein
MSIRNNFPSMSKLTFPRRIAMKKRLWLSPKMALHEY